MKYLPKEKKEKRIYTRDKHLNNDFREQKGQETLDLESSEQIINEWILKGNLEKKLEILKDNEQSKAFCKKCQSQRWIFCSKCKELLIDRSKLPSYDFPVECIIYKHSTEKDKRSSVYPLQFFTRNSRLLSYPEDTSSIQTIGKEKGVYILYPHKDAVSQKENYGSIN